MLDKLNEIEKAALESLDEFSREKSFKRWELLFRYLSSQGKLSYDAFDESCEPEGLNEILFEQTTQLLDDWMIDRHSEKPVSEKSLFHLAYELLNAILERNFPFIKKSIRLIHKRVYT